MKDFFINSIKAKKLSETEMESLTIELETIKRGFISLSTTDLSSIRPSISALLLYGLQNEAQKREVLDFIDWYKEPKSEYKWSETFEALISRIYGDIQLKRVGALLENINFQKSFTNVNSASELVSSINDPKLSGLYENKVDELGIDFNVLLLPFKLEVLDPRIVTVKPGKSNEMHRHAHETVFIFLKGQGKVIVDNYENEVTVGDFALIPRWSIHQSVNLGTEDLVFLAVADYGLTGKSFIGNYSKTSRMKS